MKYEILRCRKSCRMTQLEFAKYIGVSQEVIGMVESGHRGISKALAIKLFNLDPDKFPLEKLLGSS
tara:strand:+ start:274 stop:471 length:198 start_codon:yes stop_codon:yes gene_type:complete